MENPITTDLRLTELEIKASFTEDLLDKLDQVIIRQQQQIEFLLRELTELRKQVPEASQAAGRNAHDDLPPHY